MIWAWTLRHAGFVSELAAAAVFRLEHIWTNQSPIGAVCPHPRSIRFWLASKAFHDTHEKSFFDQVIHFDLQSDDDRDLTTLDIALRDELDCDALCWLILSVSDNDAGAVGFQALGAAEPYSPLAERLIARGVARASQQRLLSNSNWYIPAQAARAFRTIILLRELAPTPSHSHILGSVDNRWDFYWRLESGRSYPDVELIFSALVLPFDASDLYAHGRYQAIRDAPGDWTLSPSLSFTSLLLTTIPGISLHHLLVFLLHCNLDDISSRHWTLLMPKLWETAGPCPRHGPDLSDCSSSCLPELFSCLILQGNLDGVLLRMLWDKGCMHLTAPLSCLPTFSRYIISDAFLDHAHEPVALQRVQYYIDSPNGWRGTTTLPAAWMTAWRYLAFLLRSRSHRLVLDSPFNLIAAALSDGKHPYYTRFVEAPLFPMTVSAGDFLRSILLVPDSQTRPIPSLWALVCEDAHSVTPSLDIIAAALCALSRLDVEAHELITPFLEPMHFASIILRLSNFEQYYATEYAEVAEQPSIRANTVRICVHLMELCPSWWTHGMNQLMHEVLTDEDILQSQRFAEEIMAEALAHGPCHDCPSTMTPLAFDYSLRSFTLFPFAVYPLVGTDTDSA